MRANLVVAGAIALLMTGATLQAQTLKNTSGPANFPPASYTGQVFVDNAGCMYIRAGRGNRVTWVPRVTRSRQLVCGFKPSVVGGGANVQTAAAPATNTVNSAATNTVAAATASTAARAPAATGSNRRQPTQFQPFSLAVLFGLAPARARQPAVQPQQQSTASGGLVFASVQPATTTTAPRQPSNPTSGLVFQPYANERAPVRYGAQWSDPYTWVSQPVLRDPYTGQTISRNTPQTAGGSYLVIPEGYKPVYQPGRLNTRRGVSSGNGDAQMNLVWTQTVPRRLINASTGRDVTDQYQLLQYPYTNLNQQQVHYSTRAKNWVLSSKVIASTESEPDVVIVATAETVLGVSEIQDAVGSPAKAKRASGAYVQVATFGVPANAVRTTAKFAALGLPTHARSVRSKGRDLQIILLGPFLQSAEVNDALRRARSAGFSDAFATN